MATFASSTEVVGARRGCHLVAPAVRERGHDAVAVDLPNEHE